MRNSTRRSHEQTSESLLVFQEPQSVGLARFPWHIEPCLSGVICLGSYFAQVRRLVAKRVATRPRKCPKRAVAAHSHNPLAARKPHLP
jgi:hypothetical protein